MAISFIASVAGVNTATMPTHAVGDLIVVYAFRDGSTTAPTNPTGFTSIGTVTGTTCSMRVSVKVATSTSETVGTVTNASRIAIGIYRGVGSWGSLVTAVGTGATLTYPAVNTVNDNSTSWVVAGLGHRSINVATETPPTGMTNRATGVDAVAELSLHDTNGAVNDYAVQTVAGGGTASGWISAALELRVPAAIGAWQSIAVDNGGPSAITNFTVDVGAAAAGRILSVIYNKIAEYPDNTTPTSMTLDPSGAAVAGTLDLRTVATQYEHLVAVATFVIPDAMAGSQTLAIGSSPNTWAGMIHARVLIGFDPTPIIAAATYAPPGGGPAPQVSLGTLPAGASVAAMIPHYSTTGVQGWFSPDTLEFSAWANPFNQYENAFLGVNNSITTAGAWTVEADHQNYVAPLVAVAYGLAAGEEEPDPITGTAAITDAEDAGSGAGFVSLKGTNGPTELLDPVYGQAGISLRGAGASVEAPDTVATAGGGRVSGAGAADDAPDTVTAVGGRAPAIGTASIADEDAITAVGGVALKGNGAAADDPEAVAGEGTQEELPVVGNALLDDGDTLAGTGAARATALAALDDAAEAIASSGGASLRGSAAQLDADQAAGAGGSRVSGSAAIPDAGDTLEGVAWGEVFPLYGWGVFADALDVVAGTASARASGVAVLPDLETTAGGGSISLKAGGAVADDDAPAAAGATSIKASAAIADAVDELLASDTATVGGAGVIAEPEDGFTASGRASTKGGAQLVDADALAATAAIWAAGTGGSFHVDVGEGTGGIGVRGSGAILDSDRTDATWLVRATAAGGAPYDDALQASGTIGAPPIASIFGNFAGVEPNETLAAYFAGGNRKPLFITGYIAADPVCDGFLRSAFEVAGWAGERKKGMANLSKKVVSPKGDSLSIIVSVRDLNGAVSLAGVTGIEWRIGVEPSDLVPLIEKNEGAGVTVVDTLAGLFRVDLSAAETEALPAGDYFHQARLTFSDGEVKTIVREWLTIQETL